MLKRLLRFLRRLPRRWSRPRYTVYRLSPGSRYPFAWARSLN
ncbi:MAG TPA: hypothetical protein VMG10_10725 [Gemmataceae bacterium]|nr:hypothetical protein [Gemmataceae bacterium]